MTEDREISIFLKKADEYIASAIKNEKSKKYGAAKRYYLMSAKALLEAAQKSPQSLKEKRKQKADKLVKRARSLPSPIKDEKGKENVVQMLARPDVTFDDVAGLQKMKQKIEDLIITPFDYPEIAKKWKVRTGGGVLLYGPPGTGKTLLAKAVAGELNADFFYIKASDIMSKWVGESERRVAELFEKAGQCERAVIFIDEIDALLPKRTGQSSTIMARVVPQFLAEMDGIDSKHERILLMAATNIPWNLDKAALRPGRFDFKFHVPLPDYEARRRIFELNIDVPRADDFDLDTLADLTDGYSGADIKLICDEVKRDMFRKEINGEAHELQTEHVSGLITDIEPSVDRQMLKKYDKFATKEEKQ